MAKLIRHFPEILNNPMLILRETRIYRNLGGLGNKRNLGNMGNSAVAIRFPRILRFPPFLVSLVLENNREEKLKILKHRTHQHRRRLRLAAMLMSTMVLKLLGIESVRSVKWMR